MGTLIHFPPMPHSKAQTQPAASDCLAAVLEELLNLQANALTVLSNIVVGLRALPDIEDLQPELKQLHEDCKTLSAAHRVTQIAARKARQAEPQM